MSPVSPFLGSDDFIERVARLFFTDALISPVPARTPRPRNKTWKLRVNLGKLDGRLSELTFSTSAPTTVQNRSSSPAPCSRSVWADRALAFEYRLFLNGRAVLNPRSGDTCFGFLCFRPRLADSRTRGNVKEREASQQRPRHYTSL